jgi:two-component system, NarL family, sensor kinase
MIENSHISFLVILSILIMLSLFIGFLVIFILTQRKKYQYHKDVQQLREKQQNQLIQAAVRSEETERHRIAEALHDEVGAILSSSKLHFQGVKPANLTDRDRQLYERGKELLDDAIQKVRGISHNLHSSILKEFGLNEAIRHFLKKVTQEAMSTTTSLDDSYTTQNTENDISIYRMVQELVNNILKHAGASEISVTSVFTNNVLELVIAHNGIGLTQQQFEELRYKKEGLGLKNIQNRVILLNGKIEFSAQPGGYQINIQIPVKSPEHE